MVLPLCARITALREALPPETAASVVCAGELRRERGAPPLATGIEALDRLLSGGLARGKLVEIVGRRSSGRLAVALSTIACATGRGENSALVDFGDALDPDNAAAAGVDLRRLFWVRPRRVRDAVYAAEVVIGAGFPLVVLDLGVPPVGGRVPDVAWVRLARAARAHDTFLLVTSPYPMSGAAAEVVLRLDRGVAGWRGTGSSPWLLAGLAAPCVVEKKRGERPGQAAVVRFAVAEAMADKSAAARTMTDKPAVAS
jgi:hypothetical protein